MPSLEYDELALYDIYILNRQIIGTEYKDRLQGRMVYVVLFEHGKICTPYTDRSWRTPTNQPIGPFPDLQSAIKAITPVYNSWVEANKHIEQLRIKRDLEWGNALNNLKQALMESGE